MIVCKSRRYAVRREGYVGSGIVDMSGSLLARYATKAMLVVCDNAMQHIFGFIDDYSKVTRGMRDTLQLIRRDENDSLFGAGAGAGRVVLSKLAWSLPIV